MDNYTTIEIETTLKILKSIIANCQKMQPKFSMGTPQYTLLKNRINALEISISLLSEKEVSNKYNKEELIKALDSITSIINKCEKAQMKYTEGTAYHTRLKNIISAMLISKEYIDCRIETVRAYL